MAVNYVCSLGALCVTSRLMERNNIKKFSCPFDWIYSTPSIILDCINDDFIKFLNIKYCRMPSNHYSNTHTHYFPSYLNMFTHKNPLKIDDYNYFVRCIERFKILLKKEENKLFIITIPDIKTYIKTEIHVKNNNVHKLQKEDIIKFNDEFKKHTKNYKLLCIFQKTSESKIFNIETYDNIDFLTINTLSIINGIEFENNEDNIFLDSIIKNYYKFDLYDNI